LVEQALRLLLDTHALLWLVAGHERLTPAAREALTDGRHEVYVSAVSAYEIAFKHQIGKLETGHEILDDFAGHLRRWAIVELAVAVEHARRAGALDWKHRDPWDRLLVAQALAEDMTLVSNERSFEVTGVSRLW
jgi:PIN domain nuclease of toxin-antitoxin system